MGPYIIRFFNVLMIHLFIANVSFAVEANPCIEFKEVLFDLKGFNPAEYTNGVKNYTRYKKDEMPESFWIKNKPIESVCIEDILMFRIVGALIQSPESYYVKVWVKPKAEEKLKRLTSEYSNRYLAIVVDNRVVKISMVGKPLTNFFGILYGDIKLSKVLADFEIMRDVIEVCENIGPRLNCSKLVDTNTLYYKP